MLLPTQVLTVTRVNINLVCLTVSRHNLKPFKQVLVNAEAAVVRLDNEGATRKVKGAVELPVGAVLGVVAADLRGQFT